MKKLSVVFLLLVSITRAYSNNLTDSIGIRHIDGNRFILHEVRSSETLYGLLKKYNCTDDEVFAANPELKNSSRIYINQVLRFPSRSGTIVSENTNTKKRSPIVYTSQNHTVKRGETLYAICKKYGISLSQLRTWNGLSGSTIKPGQSLIVNKTARSQAISEPNTVTPVVEKIVVTTKVSPAKSLPPVSEEVTEFVVPNAPVGERFEEIGIAQVISTDNRTFKHLALHKTAPYGTLLMVTNEANNAHVMVKVIGKLPETGENSDVLVRLSPSAFQKLKPRDTRLRAKVAYTLAPRNSK